MTKIMMLSWKPLLKIEVERENSGFRRKFPDVSNSNRPPLSGHLWPFSLAFSTLQYIRERENQAVRKFEKSESSGALANDVQLAVRKRKETRRGCLFRTESVGPSGRQRKTKLQVRPFYLFAWPSYEARHGRERRGVRKQGRVVSRF